MDPTRRRPVGYLCQMRYTQPRPQRADHIPVHVTGRKLSSAVAGHAPALRCPLPSAWSSHCQSPLAARSSLRVGLPGSASDWMLHPPGLPVPFQTTCLRGRGSACFSIPPTSNLAFPLSLGAAKLKPAPGPLLTVSATWVPFPLNPLPQSMDSKVWYLDYQQQGHQELDRNAGSQAIPRPPQSELSGAWQSFQGTSSWF